MERAPLRPVPRRPDGPVDPTEAIAYVAGSLPSLDEAAHAALGLVEIAGHSRAEVAKTRALSHEQVADTLARGRKALRRTLYPLPGSGWCERAERMISDRLDGELEPPAPRRLDAHLRNCPRCVEHDLRLAQAIDALVVGFLETHPAPAARAAPARIRPAEAIVKAARPELRVLPFGQPVAPPPQKTRAAAIEAPPVEPPPVEPPPVEEPPIVEPPVEEPPVEVPTQPPAETKTGGLASALAWRAMYVAAVLLAVLTVVITALGVAGVDPF